MISALCSLLNGLGSLGDGTGPEASGADLHLNGLPFPDRLDFMEVGIPHPAGLIVGMAHIVTEYRSFTADLTFFRHF